MGLGAFVVYAVVQICRLVSGVNPPIGGFTEQSHHLHYLPQPLAAQVRIAAASRWTGAATENRGLSPILACMACGTEPPVLPDVTNNPAANDPDFFKTPRKLVRQKWLGGLHSSYRWAA